jgi:hypothetical protein
MSGVRYIEQEKIKRNRNSTENSLSRSQQNYALFLEVLGFIFLLAK